MVKYSLDGADWHDSNAFNNLAKGSCAISVRLKGSEYHHAGEIKTVSMLVSMLNNAKINSISSLQITTDTIILEVIAGA